MLKKLFFILQCGCDEVGEEWVRCVGFRLELWMKLHAYIPRVIGDFDDFDEVTLGVDAADS